MTEEPNPHYRLVLSTHPDDLQASAMLFFAALAYPELTHKAQTHRLRYYEALVAFFAQATVKNAASSGLRLPAAREKAPKVLRDVRHDRIARAFNMAGRRIDRRLGAVYILRGITTPEIWSLQPQLVKMPITSVEGVIKRRFGDLDSIFDAHATSKASPGEEMEKGARGNIRQHIWKESLPVLHLASQLNDELIEQAEVLAPWQNKVIGLINRPDWLPGAVRRAQRTAANLLPFVLTPAEMQCLLPLVLTSERY